MNVGLLLYGVCIAVMFAGNFWVGLAGACVMALAFGEPPAR